MPGPSESRGPSNEPTSAPRRVGRTDVERLVTAARTWRAEDYRYGGGSCRDAVLGLLSSEQELLDAQATDHVATGLHGALADLHNLAGWTCFDTGLPAAAHIQFRRALALAREGDHDALIANIQYRIGRVHLHHHAPDEALTRFQLGRDAGRASGSEHAIAILCANQAWAYAMMGLADRALALLDESRRAFDQAIARAELDHPPTWAAFFGETDLHAMTGSVHTELARTADTQYARSAIPALSHAVRNYSDDMARSKTFNMVSLAVCHLIDGDTDHATRIGADAVALAGTLDSARPADRLRPLKEEADKRHTNANARVLSQRIATFIGS